MHHLYPRDIRLLLVEDNPADVWLLREALRLAQLPIQLTVARDGMEATRHLHQLENTPNDHPDLVLLDLNLPRRNGREVLAEMKRSPTLQSIPVVILSSSTSDDERRQVSRLQAAGFITKPSGLPAYIEMVCGIERFWLASRSPQNCLRQPAPHSLNCAFSSSISSATS